MTGKSESKAAERDEILKRMLKMPPKPHQKAASAKGKSTKKRPKRVIKPSE